MTNKEAIALQRKYEGRGKFLTTMIIGEVFMFLVYPLFLDTLSSIPSIYVTSISYPTVSSWYMIEYCIEAVIIVGILCWKRTAVYGFLVFKGGNTLINILWNFATFKSFLHILAPGVLFMFGLWFWAIERKWQLFE